ncbi:MAG: hypothetical protein [Wendovervirus sonii]|uniref:Virion structural protein n=1 Tax=phage Lak_Megaphage_Sonny TaxID=3109229 RepID=A0ABZ0Z2M0_9CAUD|nr:MAG: hypothetical protein [phage Lak_Megaphage_Sonny]
MKNLYNKIYEAINTGIQKAIILDDEDDISINYQYKKIVNNSNLMPYYVEELLQDSNNKFINYKQIIKYYKETGYKYKVKNYDELKNIYNVLCQYKKISFEWISNIKDYISIVLENDTEINFYEKTDKKPLFLKFANDDILGTENEILIYLYDNHLKPKEDYRWQTKPVQIQNDKYLISDINKIYKDYTGYETCLRIQKKISKNPEKYGETPAIDYCLNLNISGYQGYLPTIGQLQIVFDNLNIINYILKYLNFNEISSIRWWWQTSSEASYNKSWLFYYGKINMYGKIEYYQAIIPFFHKINNKL